MMTTWELSAVDTLFFKESRPMEAPGSSELGSVFPPPMRTIAGAIRSHIGESRGDDWANYESNQAFKEIIGYGEDYANMHFQGVWLHYKGVRYYPAPLNLLAEYGKDKEREKIIKKGLLYVDQACECDLGRNVRLVSLPNGLKGKNALNQHWLNADGLASVMAGKFPDDKDILPLTSILEEENRLGIGRDNKKRVVKESMLYQTRHLRLNKHSRISIDIEGLDGHLTEGTLKLGGEGRMANLKNIAPELAQKKDFPLPPENIDNAIGIIIYLLTPMLLPENSAFLPNFKIAETDTETVWKGELNNTPLTLVSSVIGKTHREGGWDIAAHKPVAVKSMIPAGSVFYCEVCGADGDTQDLASILLSLNNTQIGEQQHLGRGHIATGVWFANTDIKSTEGHAL